VDEVRDLDGGLLGERGLAGARLFEERLGSILDRRRDPFDRRPTSVYVERDEASMTNSRSSLRPIAGQGAFRWGTRRVRRAAVAHIGMNDLRVKVAVNG
jgi:hypothetical protein